MPSPSLEEINNLRKKNLRPVVVGCFLYEKSVLFVYKEKHELWQLPQGGIENKEELEDAFVREMSEELDSTFVKKAGPCQYSGQDVLEFPTHLHGSRSLVTDEGEEVIMEGKAYLFCKSEVNTKELDISQTEFDEYRWVPLADAKEFVYDTIYQKGKQRVTIEALSALIKS
ncbi:NUDIX domain-containing protein [Patescibacteria group bacterium]|nr:NUDIX domain-containing protein [Patescibacteria group bacterium]